MNQEMAPRTPEGERLHASKTWTQETQRKTVHDGHGVECHRLFSHDSLRLLFGVAMFALGVLGGGVFAGEDYPFFFRSSIIFLVVGVMAISSWLTGVDPEIWVRK
jgi:hypothetical protein